MLQGGGETSTMLEGVRQVNGPCGNVTLTVRQAIITTLRAASASPSPSAPASAGRRRQLANTNGNSHGSGGDGGGNGGGPGGVNSLVMSPQAAAGTGTGTFIDTFLLLSVSISGWEFSSLDNRAVLDIKINRPAMRLGWGRGANHTHPAGDNTTTTAAPDNSTDASGRFAPLESYAMPYDGQLNADGTMTYGLLRLYTVATVDGGGECW